MPSDGPRCADCGWGHPGPGRPPPPGRSTSVPVVLADRAPRSRGSRPRPRRSPPVASWTIFTAASATSIRSCSSVSDSTTTGTGRGRRRAAVLQRLERALHLPGPQRGHRRHLLVADRLLGAVLDVLQLPPLARLGEGDRHALTPGPAHPADAVHVGVGHRRGNVVVDDVGELVDVESPGGHVGGHDEVGGARCAVGPSPGRAGLLVHAAVQRLGPVAAPVERLGQLVDLVAGPAEHDRRRRRLDVEDATERGRLVVAGDHVGPLATPAVLVGTCVGCRSAPAPGRSGAAWRSTRCAAATWPRTAPSAGRRGWPRGSPRCRRRSPCRASRRPRRAPRPSASRASACPARGGRGRGRAWRPPRACPG
jgi:hypothetical protein